MDDASKEVHDLFWDIQDEGEDAAAAICRGAIWCLSVVLIIDLKLGVHAADPEAYLVSDNHIF